MKLVCAKQKSQFFGNIFNLFKSLNSFDDRYANVRSFLKTKYLKRLEQKVAGRLPVNLRYTSTDEGVSEEKKESFVTLSVEDLKMQLAEIFRKASSRLLIIGLPGSGKTIVLLHLALEFLKTEKNFYPIILNLATWNKKFNTLNDWLSEILIAELSNNNKLSLKLLKDKKFIFLFDGFDEIEENSRQEFLVAMQQFWADAKQKYVITSRIEEYAQFADNILTYRPIKVESLNFEQIETELKKQAFKQPEAKILLNALKADSLLQKVAEVPFYFNTLQLLFASGKKLSEFNFRSQNVTARQNEIVERFVENELKQIDALQYEPKKVLHWLSFLAFKMTDFDLVVFELADLQYYWWKWSLDESFGINFLYNYLENISLIFFGSLTILMG